MSKKQNLICIGRRVFSEEKGQLSYAFRETPNGKDFYFTKVKYVYPGHIYAAEIDVKGSRTMSRVPVDLGEADVSEEIMEGWKREDRNAEAFSKRVTATRKGERHAQNVARECSQLRYAVRGMTYSQMRAFIEAVVDEIQKLEKQKG